MDTIFLVNLPKIKQTFTKTNSTENLCYKKRIKNKYSVTRSIDFSATFREIIKSPYLTFASKLQLYKIVKKAVLIFASKF